jgi:hypothetical protein
MNYDRLLSVLASTVNRVRRVETLAGVNELPKGEQAGFDSLSICLHHIEMHCFANGRTLSVTAFCSVFQYGFRLPLSLKWRVATRLARWQVTVSEATPQALLGSIPLHTDKE